MMNSKMSPWLVLLASILFSASAQGALTNIADFETGDLSQVRSTQGCCSYSITVVSNPVRIGSYAVKMDTRVGDPPVAGGNHRAEVLVGNAGMGEYWYGWSVYIPSDWDENLPNSTGHWVNITQWHNATGVPLYLNLRGNEVSFVHNSQLTGADLFPGKIIGSVDSMLGKWTDFVAHINWSTSTNGYFKIWMNGVQVVNWTGVTVPTGSGNPYWKAGFNYASDESRVMYVDEMRMGDSGSSFDEVDPAAYGGELSVGVTAPFGLHLLQ
jgi:Polysaccharide lyase